FAFCGAIFALTGAAFAAENIAAAADKNAAESESGEFGISYSDFSQYGDFNSSTKTDLSSHPFSLNPEPFDLPADAFAAEPDTSQWGRIFFVVGGIAAVAAVANALDNDNTPPPASSDAGNDGGGGDGMTPPAPPVVRCVIPRAFAEGSLANLEFGSARRPYTIDFADISASNLVRYELDANDNGVLDADENLGNLAQAGLVGGETVFEISNLGLNPVRATLVLFIDDTETSDAARAFYFGEIAEGAACDAASGVPDSAQSRTAGTPVPFVAGSEGRTTGGADPAEFPFHLDKNLRGLLDEKYAVRLRNFYFAADDSQLRDFHLEYRANFFGDESENGGGGESSDPSGFSAFAESGYKRQNGGRTQLVYNKLTAMQNLSAQTAIYAQGANGQIKSEIYRNAKLRGFAGGVFADGIFSHNDSYHLRIESPLADERATEPRFAIDARIGTPKEYLRFGIRRNLEDEESAAKFLWLREF
ncbi:MAG: hypothetical protein ACR2QC_01650, partial [Gammaproteobacteria bacterium]